MKKMLITAVMVCMCAGFVSANGPIVDFDGSGSRENSELGRVRTVPIEVPQQAELFTIKADAGAKLLTLADMVSGCSQKNRIEFYKSLVFVNGILASVNTETIKECANSDEIAALLYIPGRPLLKNTMCTCRFPPDKPAYLMCYNDPPNKCNSASCRGTCDSSKFAAGYFIMADMFLKVPEDIARGFAGSLILNEGKVGGYDYGDISRYLGTDEAKAVLGHLTGN